MVNCQTLIKRSDFQNLTHKSQAFKTPAFILLYAPYTGEEAAQKNLPPNTVRIGYTATKRSIGNAVKRNRAKRRLRALADAFMRLNPQLELPEGVQNADVVFIARHSIADIPHTQLEADMQKTLGKMGCKFA